MLQYIITGVATGVLTYLGFILIALYLEREVFAGFVRRREALVSVLSGVVSLVLVRFVETGFGDLAVWLAAGLAILGSAALAFTWRDSLPDESATFVTRKNYLHKSWAGPILNGLGFGALVTIPSWSDKTRALTDIPTKNESRIYLFLFIALLAVSQILVIVLRRRSYRRLPTSVKLRGVAVRTFAVPSLLGICVASIQYFTRNTVFANRYYEIALFAAILYMVLWHLVLNIPSVKSRLASELEQFKKTQSRHKKSHKRKRRK
jgi:hypothetical protein